MVTEVEFEEIPGVLALHLANKTVLKVTEDSKYCLGTVSIDTLPRANIRKNQKKNNNAPAMM